VLQKILMSLSVIVIICCMSNHAWAVKSTLAEMITRENWLKENLDLSASKQPFSFIFNGQYVNSMLSKWKKEVRTQKSDNNRTQQIITFIDSAHGLEVRVEISVFNDFPAVEWVLYLKNSGKADTPVLENILPLDMRIPLSDTAPVLHYSRGALCCIDDFAPVEKILNPKTYLALQPGGGRSSSEVTPFFNIDLGGRGIVLGIGWTGEWAATFHRDEGNNLELQAGMALTHLKLHPGEEVRSPRILLLFWQGQSVIASDQQRLRGNNLLRRFILAHHRPHPNG